MTTLYELHRYNDTLAPAVLDIVNTYSAGWPYSRPLDAALLAHWAMLDARYQPEHMLLASRDGIPLAFLHGERDGTEHFVNVLAMRPGQVEAAAWLLRQAAEEARRDGVARLIGPCWRANAFYGGFLCGCEPYHPHWASDGTEAYIRAGFRISHPAVILIHATNAPALVRPMPDGYLLAEGKAEEEYQAISFRFMASADGEEAATCTARVYPQLAAPSGGLVGQIGFVGTHEAHRGKGLAKCLVTRCLDRLRILGASETLIATGLDNFPALQAYEGVGFTRRYNINEWSRALPS